MLRRARWRGRPKKDREHWTKEKLEESKKRVREAQEQRRREFFDSIARNGQKGESDDGSESEDWSDDFEYENQPTDDDEDSETERDDKRRKRKKVDKDEYIGDDGPDDGGAEKTQPSGRAITQATRIINAGRKYRGEHLLRQVAPRRISSDRDFTLAFNRLSPAEKALKIVNLARRVRGEPPLRDVLQHVR